MEEEQAHARAVLRAWLKKQVRRLPANKLDPITLEPLPCPVFLLVNASGCTHGFNPVTLAKYFLHRRLFDNPFTREKLNRVEMKRLVNLLPADQAAAVSRAFAGDGDGDGDGDDGNGNGNDGRDGRGDGPVFSESALARSVHFIITCMLDLCRVSPDLTLINGYTADDVLNIFNLILMPCLFTSSVYERSVRGHNSLFLRVVNEGIALVNVLRTVNRGLQYLYFCEALLASVSNMLMNLAASAARLTDADGDGDGDGDVHE